MNMRKLFRDSKLGVGLALSVAMGSHVKLSSLYCRITAMMMVVVGCFGVCWFPFSVMFVLLPTNSEAFNPYIIELITWIGKNKKNRMVNSSI